MESAFLTIAATSGEWIAASIVLAVAITLAFVIDRFVITRAGRVAARVGDGGISRAAQTRLRLIRRLVFTLIIVVGLAIALSQFDELDKLATGLLASSAVVGIVLGVAARALIANPLAGIQLAVSQPIRIGDTVTIADETGSVEDLTLSHTYINTHDGRMVIVPNETVVTSVVINRSTGDRTAPSAVSLWVPPATDLGKVREVLSPLEPSAVEIAEMTPDGVRVVVHGPRRLEGTRDPGEESALRERAHRALREAKLLG